MRAVPSLPRRLPANGNARLNATRPARDCGVSAAVRDADSASKFSRSTLPGRSATVDLTPVHCRSRITLDKLRCKIKVRHLARRSPDKMQLITQHHSLPRIFPALSLTRRTRLRWRPILQYVLPPFSRSSSSIYTNCTPACLLVFSAFRNASKISPRGKFPDANL